MPRILTLMVTLALSVGCAAGAAATPTAPPTAPPTTAPTPTPATSGIILVKSEPGSGTCDITSYEEHSDGANSVINEHFSCKYDMSDDRLDGQMEADYVTTVEPSTSPAMHWQGTVTITNAAGTWTGPARGAVVMWADRSGPTNYGEGTYEGTGAYAGLVYHEHLVASDSGLDLPGGSGGITGWISAR